MKYLYSLLIILWVVTIILNNITIWNYKKRIENLHEQYFEVCELSFTNGWLKGYVRGIKGIEEEDFKIQLSKDSATFVDTHLAEIAKLK